MLGRLFYNRFMAAPVLATKLYTPSLRSNLVPRSRLIERLYEGLQRMPGVTLISAPAGFGKTTLASEWVANCGRVAAWLSLDEGDNDPDRFLRADLFSLLHGNQQRDWRHSGYRRDYENRPAA